MKEENANEDKENKRLHRRSYLEKKENSCSGLESRHKDLSL
jgi:hypothetical protein